MVSAATTREEVHRLIDSLITDEEISAFKEFLDRVRSAEHRVERSLLIANLREPEELSEEDAEAIQHALDEIEQGDAMRHKAEIRKSPRSEA